MDVIKTNNAWGELNARMIALYEGGMETECALSLGNDENVKLAKELNDARLYFISVMRLMRLEWGAVNDDPTLQVARTMKSLFRCEQKSDETLTNFMKRFTELKEQVDFMVDDEMTVAMDVIARGLIFININNTFKNDVSEGLKEQLFKDLKSFADAKAQIITWDNRRLVVDRTMTSSKSVNVKAATVSNSFNSDSSNKKKSKFKKNKEDRESQKGGSNPASVTNTSSKPYCYLCAADGHWTEKCEKIDKLSPEQIRKGLVNKRKAETGKA